MNNQVDALGTDLIILAKALRRLDGRVTALAAGQITPAGEFCVVAANTGMDGPTGFQLRPETIDSYLNSFGELPEGINLQDSRIFPESGLLEMRYVMLDSIYDYDIEIVAGESLLSDSYSTSLFRRTFTPNSGYSGYESARSAQTLLSAPRAACGAGLTPMPLSNRRNSP
ncbi:MAG: hypothetical protein OXF54_22970 [Caldilineaceae bacterium]|nr:hypothetical protein [Caldilineaceae bacterium]